MEILRTGSLTALSAFSKVNLSLSTPSPAPRSLGAGIGPEWRAPVNPNPQRCLQGLPRHGELLEAPMGGGCEGRGSFAVPVALPPPATCTGKREAGAARPAPQQSQWPRQHGGTRCPPDPEGKRLCKRNCKEHKPSEPSKNTFYFFSLFELNGKKQILSPSQMGHGVLAHY